jgi:REP element-mobilizing transposase RayT
MSYSTSTLPIQKGGVYHIYNHSIGSEKPFKLERDFKRMISDLSLRLPAVSEVYAFCILSNHMHLMLKVTAEPAKFSKTMGDALNAYAKWYNTLNHRMGGMFVSPFKRRLVNDHAYMSGLPWYIHRNPLHHHITPNWETYPWSSYQYYVNPHQAPAFLNTSFLLNHYGGQAQMLAHHQAAFALWKEDELI